MKEFNALCDCILVKNGHKCYKQYGSVILLEENKPYLWYTFY